MIGICGRSEKALFITGPLASAAVQELDLDGLGGVVGLEPFPRSRALHGLPWWDEADDSASWAPSSSLGNETS